MRTKTKNKVFNLCKSVLICVLLIFVFSISAYAESIDDIRVIKISAHDQRAIIKTTERELRIIKVGDVLQVQSSPLRNHGFLDKGAGSYQPGNEQLNSYQQRNEQLKSYQQSAVSGQQEKQSKNNEQRTAFRNQHKIVELKVVEIAKGRVVLEEETENGIETVIIRLDKGKQTVERIKRTPDEQPVFYAPQLDTDKH